MNYLVLLIVIRGFIIYCSTREHLLTTLLRLEFMVLGIFFSLLIRLSLGSYFYCLFYLIITACEGALGLSILVIIRRTHGGDYFKSLSFLIN